MKFYIYFEVDLRRYFATRWKDKEVYNIVLVDEVNVEFPKGSILSKDKNNSDIVIFPTGEIIPLWQIDIADDGKTLYWEDRSNNKIIYFNEVGE